MENINYHTIGGTMVFYNSDQSISGEAMRSNNSTEISVLVENGSLSDEEKKQIIKLYFQSGADKR